MVQSLQADHKTEVCSHQHFGIREGIGHPENRQHSSHAGANLGGRLGRYCGNLRGLLLIFDQNGYYFESAGGYGIYRNSFARCES